MSLNRFPAASLTETRRAIEAGSSTIQGEIDACRGRIDAIEPQLAAFTLVNDGPPPIGPDLPLAGIAVGVKDLYDTAGMTTCYGSPVFRDHVPEADAALVAHLKRLGAYVAGKTVTTEFAWREPGPTVNPWNPAHTPGGSSSGSAAAVAAGLVPLATGTQTFGSVIRPAAFCGVVGFKPSYGLLPLDGVKPLSQSLDHAGLFARSVEDIGHVMTLLTEGEAGASAGRGEGSAPPRIRVVRGPCWDSATATQRRVVEDACARFAALGAEVEHRELPPEFDRAIEVAEVLFRYEGGRNFEQIAAAHPDLVSGHIHELVAQGRQIPESRYQEALARRDELGAAFADEMSGFDTVLALPALGEAPPLRDGTGNPAPCVLWTLLGVPALAIPWARGADDLPLGLQLVAARGADAALLRTGGWCESGRPA